MTKCLLFLRLQTGSLKQRINHGPPNAKAAYYSFHHVKLERANIEKRSKDWHHHLLSLTQSALALFINPLLTSYVCIISVLMSSQCK